MFRSFLKMVPLRAIAVHSFTLKTATNSSSSTRSSSTSHLVPKQGEKVQVRAADNVWTPSWVYQSGKRSGVQPGKIATGTVGTVLEKDYGADAGPGSKAMWKDFPESRKAYSADPRAVGDDAFTALPGCWVDFEGVNNNWKDEKLKQKAVWLDLDKTYRDLQPESASAAPPGQATRDDHLDVAQCVHAVSNLTTAGDRFECTEPLYLQCSCKCGANQFSVGPCNRPQAPDTAGNGSRSQACSAASSGSDDHCVRVEDKVDLRNDGPKYDNASPVEIARCHCQNCRKHTGASWGTYLQAPHGRFTENCLNWSHKNFELVPFQCDGVMKDCDACARVACPNCYSFLGLMSAGEPVEGEDPNNRFLLVHAGVLTDGDYSNFNKGRRPDESVWPEKKFACLARRNFNTTHYAEDQAAPWYAAREAKMPNKQWTNKEKAVKAAISRGERYQPEMTGGCYCGACRYECTLFPPELQHCYCSLCRKLSGSDFQSWCPVESKHVKWTGNEHLKLVATTAFGKRHTCMQCFSTMTIIYNDDPKSTWFAAGSYDDECCHSEEYALHLKRKEEEEAAKNFVDEEEEDDDDDVSSSSTATNFAPDGSGKKKNKTRRCRKSLKDLRGQKTEENLTRLCHICCRSVQPWFEIPLDIGDEFMPDAC